MKVLSSLILGGSIACSIGCGGPDPTHQDKAMQMTLLARVERSPSHVVSFYDSELGIVISEQGSAEDLSDHAPLDNLRSAGMQIAYRALAHDESVEVPASLLDAETAWQARQNKPTLIPGISASPPAETAAAQTFPTSGVLTGSQSERQNAGGIQQVQSALGGLSGDAAWWQTLPICKYKTYGASPSGNAPYVVGWFDGVWCVTDVTWATTSWRDTMYYESTAFAQGNDANMKINKWINGAWQTVVNTTVAYRFFQTFSFPPENGAYYQTFVTGTASQTIGISERYRLAMPQPTFLNNNPNNVSYQFSNDLQGITHDANNWYLTRTEYGLSDPKYGVIAKVPLGTSLSSEPTGNGMPSSWNLLPGGGIRYNHFGDLVHVAGLLYVGMDGPIGGAIGVYDTNLNPIAFAPTRQSPSVGLVAYNPKDGYFYVPSDASTFQRYQVTVIGSTATAVWKGAFKLNRPIPGAFQGGKFSPKGNLWILTGINEMNRQFYGIDAANGMVTITGTLNPSTIDEGEGLDIFDLDTDTRPGLSGQLHFQMLENNLGDDSWWFMHWRAPISRL